MPDHNSLARLGVKGIVSLDNHEVVVRWVDGDGGQLRNLVGHRALWCFNVLRIFHIIVSWQGVSVGRGAALIPSESL